MLLLASMLGLIAVGGVVLTTDFTGLKADDEEEDGLIDEPAADTLRENTQLLDFADSENDLLLSGGAQDDQITGGDGDDSISGGDGSDMLLGQSGDDTLLGGAGDDVLLGHDGADLLQGGAGDDELHGVDGDDTLLGGAGDDLLHGGQGDDILTGGMGQDVLFGGAGDDLISGLETASNDNGADGTPTADFLSGGAGNDTILADSGDVVEAGDGADRIVTGDWIEDGEAAELKDFEVGKDQLLMVCDLTETPDPEIEIVPDEDMPGLSHVLVDGTEVACVHSDAPLTEADIVLMDHSDGATFGLTDVTA
ncbi:calcium-binding protein [Sedimentitalea sp. HM32M-2]|uniref:calcium-binding protein n=1 Tax=Sedimentitalea sp. HM32M-2 TaxID=3351566 RepID=UPI00362A920E